MSEVVQWLNEIQDLKQQLKDARAAEEAAHASADNWRKRYEIEAIQRRNEADELRQTIQTLQTQLAQVNLLPQPSAEALVETSTLAATIDQMSPDDLKTKLLETWTERDRLAHDLQTEQAAHIQTRKNLTMALGDTVDMLTKLKQQS